MRVLVTLMSSFLNLNSFKAVIMPSVRPNTDAMKAEVNDTFKDIIITGSISLYKVKKSLINSNIITYLN